ncbi:hypothetical protein D3C84_629480 [compost metagenome]
MLQPDHIVIGRQVLVFFSTKIGVPVMTEPIAYCVDLFNANPGRDVFNDFNQKASWPKTFETFCQLPVNVQGAFALYPFVNPLHGTDENTQLTLGATQGERNRCNA